MKFLVNADDASVQLGLMLPRALNASVTVLESKDTRGHGEEAVGQIRMTGVETDLIQRESDWLRALRVVTRAYHYDLVVVGKMWRRGLSGWLFGTVPQPLLADIRTSLLIVRHSRARLVRLLAAVGMGPASKGVLRWTGLIAQHMDAQPTLVHITDRPPQMFAGLGRLDETLTRFVHSNTPEAQTFQHAAVTLRELGIEPELKLLHGLVSDEILAEAEAGGYDLILLGSSYAAQRSSRWLMGTVTERIVERAPCPVLVVRGGERAAA